MEAAAFESTLVISVVFSCFAFLLTYKIIPNFRDMFINANMFGIDMNKMTKYRVPEAQGVIAGAVFLISSFTFIPVPFYQHLTNRELDFPFQEYVQFLAALLSICCMIFLGFADDALNLRWRHKMLLPSIATLPLLMVYIVTFDLTEIIVPLPFRQWIGDSVDIGYVYYLYMGMLAVFCTNAINILAGINGIEAGQSLIIAITVIVFNFIELNGVYKEAHQFSLYFMFPFTGVCAALLIHNWYPSKVFVGDTFCYFAGMTFAVVAILGHFSKTMLLFFIPQVANFIFSVPQLFHIVPCPRHRLPRLDREKDKLTMSYAVFKTSETNILARIILWVVSLLGLSDVRYGQGEDGEYTECSNFTIINLALKILGPTHEQTLTIILLSLQVICSIIALFIRYPLARFFYEG